MKSLFVIAFLVSGLFSASIQAKTLTAEVTYQKEKLTVDLQLDVYEGASAGVTQDIITDDGHMSFCFHQLVFPVGMKTLSVTPENGRQVSLQSPLEAILTFSNNMEVCEMMPYHFVGTNVRSSVNLNTKELIPLAIKPPAGYDQMGLILTISGGGTFQALLDIESADGELYFTNPIRLLERSNLEPIVEQGLTLYYSVVATKKDGSIATLKQNSAPLKFTAPPLFTAPL